MEEITAPTPIFSFHTGLSREEVAIRSKRIGDALNSTLDSDFIPDITEKLPLVIVINGSGACGKGTFVRMVGTFQPSGSNREILEISSIDPIREAASALIRQTNDELFPYLYGAGHYPPLPKKLDYYLEHKPEEYRALLSRLKDAWAGFNDAPNVYAAGTVIKRIAGAASALSWDARSEEEVAMPLAIFVNIREPDAIDRFRDMMADCGIPTITLLMSGHTSPDDYENHSDREVDDYDYDVRIRNDGTEHALLHKAFMFYLGMERALTMHGIELRNTKWFDTEKRMHDSINTALNAGGF